METKMGSLKVGYYIFENRFPEIAYQQLSFY